ncbi:MAG: DUF4830 domain-containing protein [Geobacteraceae bacterium]|nr:DUF4830 domain-containing protein [Geobacteraceae bacterium]
MRNASYFILIIYISVSFSIMGCGSSSNTSSSLPGAEIIQQYNFHVEGSPTTTPLTLPQQFNDANWGVKENVCEQAGYSLIPHAGESISAIKYSITEKFSSEPLYLWILAKDQTCICAYLSVRENSNAGPGVMAVNTPTNN